MKVLEITLRHVLVGMAMPNPQMIGKHIICNRCRPVEDSDGWYTCRGQLRSPKQLINPDASIGAPPSGCTIAYWCGRCRRYAARAALACEVHEACEATCEYRPPLDVEETHAWARRLSCAPLHRATRTQRPVWVNCHNCYVRDLSWDERQGIFRMVR